MTPDMAAQFARDLLLQAAILSAPILICACLVSILISLLQTLTGIQEQTLTVVPRLIVVFAVMFVTLPWTIGRVIAYTVHLWSNFHLYLG